MRVPGCVLTITLLCLPALCRSNVAEGQSDQLVAARVLGPQWKDLSRRAGMIFAGTVLGSPAADRVAAGPAAAVQLSFRVDAAIAGVKSGQVLTIHEWVGAFSMHPPMVPGQRVLIFLHPLSRLGLTSPVGGSLGLILLDAGGKNVSESRQQFAQPTVEGAASGPLAAGEFGAVSLTQLERAIRRARGE